MGFAVEVPILVGADYTIHLQVYNAGKIARTVRFDDADIDTTLEIGAGKQVEFNRTFKAPSEPSTPFWLRLPHGNLYEINDYNVLGLAKLSDRMIQYTIKGEGVVKGETELHRKWNDRSI